MTEEMVESAVKILHAGIVFSSDFFKFIGKLKLRRRNLLLLTDCCGVDTVVGWQL